MLFIVKSEGFTTEVLDAISRFSDGNIYVGFTVLITLLSAGLLYVAIKKEKIDRKFFPLLWFFLITNFIFSATISMITLPLKKEAETINQEYDELRATIEKLEDVARVDHQNVSYLLEENKKLRLTLKEISAQKINPSNRKKEKKVQQKIQIPEEPKLKKAEKSFEEIKKKLIYLDSLHLEKKRESNFKN